LFDPEGLLFFGVPGTELGLTNKRRVRGIVSWDEAYGVVGLQLLYEEVVARKALQIQSFSLGEAYSDKGPQKGWLPIWGGALRMGRSSGGSTNLESREKLRRGDAHERRKTR